MRFIRKNGRIIPIRDETAKGGERADSSPSHHAAEASAAGAAGGAAFHIRRDAVANAAEKRIKNTKSVKDLQKMMQPGDILVTGSTPHTSGWHTYEDALAGIKSEKIRNAFEKYGKKVGLKKNTQVTPALSTTLAALGVGKKSHAGVYLGNGKVAHAYPSEGVFKDTLEHALHGSSATVYRFKDATKKETSNAVRYANAAVRNKVKYQKIPVASKNVLTNLGVPFLKKHSVGKERFNPAVCHTVPIRAYGRRAFEKGEHTFAGDFKFTKGLKAVARRDIGHGPKILNYIGQSLKGLKWGVAAGAAALAYGALRKRKEQK